MTESARSFGGVVYDEARVVVVDKPAGLRSEDVAAHHGRRLAHRLDALTSGLLILADDARCVQRLQRLIAHGLLERRYAFVAHGRVDDGVICSALVRDRGDGLRGGGAPDAPGAKRAETIIVGAAFDGVVTRGEAVLRSGRTHQVRIHLAEAGAPIVGDVVYLRDRRAAGLPIVPSPRLLLHARSLAFVHPHTHAPVSLSREPPDDPLWKA